MQTKHEFDYITKKGILMSELDMNKIFDEEKILKIASDNKDLYQNRDPFRLYLLTTS